VLYELLTGRRAFAGRGAAETIAATIGSEPDWDALPSDTPAPIRELLRRCLAKDSGRRIQAIVDVRRTIERAQRGWTGRQVGAMAAAACLAMVVGIGAWVRQPPPRPDPAPWLPVTRLSDAVSQPSLSADGRLVTFIRGGDTFYGPGQVYLKVLPDGEPVQLTDDTLKKMSPVFSPDGSRVAYTTVNRLFEWDTWIVAAAGGLPQEWLRNASGLSWVSPQQVLFSEIRTSPHMGIVTADEKGLGRREVYLPPHAHEMAHRSYVSPDRHWVLLVAMDKDHAWAPCRIVPMDGRSSGYEVGPPHAGCTSGAWSPDGKWIFVTSDAGGAHHIWRQRFPGGQPEQLTFGPTAEEGVAVSPDGHSLIASVALQSGSIWLHDAHGERQISALEGTAIDAKFSRDGKRLCYLIVREYPSAYATQPGEIWMADLETGATASLLPGFKVFDYDVSPDGTQVVMEGVDDRLWLAPLAQRSNARQIPNVEGRQPRYGRDGSIFFRASGFAYRVNEDGTGINPFHQPHLLILNLAVGSTGGDPSGTTFPARFEVDYVRVAQIKR
jgi:Tol biopolymer transport system component